MGQSRVREREGQSRERENEEQSRVVENEEQGRVKERERQGRLRESESQGRVKESEGQGREWESPTRRFLLRGKQELREEFRRLGIGACFRGRVCDLVSNLCSLFTYIIRLVLE